jgi:hypothetical protein
MKRILSLILLTILVSLALISCAPRTAEAPAAPAAPAASAAPAVSDGSEDLKIDYRLNLAKGDVENNYVTYSGNIRYMAAEMDQYDAVSGASKLGTTHLFQAYLYDVEGKTTMPNGLRGLFLFAVTPYDQILTDNLTVSKASDGAITIQYVHRGTAYRMITDSNGKLSFPNGKFETRSIGYIQGGGPQVLSMDFTTDGTAATVDWAKVWDSGIAGGTIVKEGNDRKTGDIVSNNGVSQIYLFDGTLDVALASDILTIKGALTAVKQ